MVLQLFTNSLVSILFGQEFCPSCILMSLFPSHVAVVINVDPSAVFSLKGVLKWNVASELFREDLVRTVREPSLFRMFVATGYTEQANFLVNQLTPISHCQLCTWKGPHRKSGQQVHRKAVERFS